MCAESLYADHFLMNIEWIAGLKMLKRVSFICLTMLTGQIVGQRTALKLVAVDAQASFLESAKCIAAAL